MTKTNRNSSFELLRIVSIIMITLHHLSMTYGLDSNSFPIQLVAQFFYIGGKVGVNCFVLIGGYYLSESEFKISRISRVHRQILCYTIVLFIIGLLFVPETITRTTIIKTFFPIVFNHYWFVTTYIGLLLLSPFLNLLLGKMTYYQHIYLISICLILFSIIPTLTTQTPYNDNLTWFCFLYELAFFFKKYNTKIKRILSNGISFCVLWMLIYASSVVMSLLSARIFMLSEGINFFSGMYILPQMLNSLSLFLFFEKRTFSSKAINYIGCHTLPCFLIQSNYTMLSLRVSFLNFALANRTAIEYVVYSMLIALSVYLVSIGVDSIRFFAIEKTIGGKFDRILDAKADMLMSKYKSCEERKE